VRQHRLADDERKLSLTCLISKSKTSDKHPPTQLRTPRRNPPASRVSDAFLTEHQRVLRESPSE
jgi:hypothetical protein